MFAAYLQMLLRVCVRVWPTGQVANAFGERKRSAAQYLKYLQLDMRAVASLSRDMSRHYIEITQVSIELAA